MITIAISEVTCAVFILFILLTQYECVDRAKSQKRLQALDVLVIVWLLSDAFSYMANSMEELWYIHLVNMSVYVLSNVVLIAFLYYCEAYMVEKTRLNKWLFRAPMVILTMDIIVDVIWYLNDKLVVYQNGEYNIIGTVPIPVYVTYLLFLFYIPALAAIKRREVGIRPFIMMIAYITPIVISIFITLTENLDLTVISGAISIIFGASILQNDRNRAIMKQNAEREVLKENNLRILALEEKFECLYDVCLDDNTYDTYVKGETYLNEVDSKLQNNGNYFDDLTSNIDSVVYPEDRESVFNALNNSSIRRVLSVNDHFDFYYRLIIKGNPVWYKLRVVNKNFESRHVIIGVFNAEEEIAAKRRDDQLRTELFKSKLLADMLRYIVDRLPDLDDFMSFFGNRIREVTGCDRVIFTDINGKSVVNSALEIGDSVPEYCRCCPVSDMDSHVYGEEGYIVIEDCSLGFGDLKPHPDCTAKSAYMHLVCSNGKPVGTLTTLFINSHHTFSATELDILNTVSIYLGFLVERIAAKDAEIAMMVAESANRAKSEFLFNMSHDIRTPMNAIIGFTEKALRHKDDPAVIDETLPKVKTSSEYLLGIVNDILDMAKIESGKLELHESLYKGNPAQETMLEVIGAEAKKKGITLNVTDDITDRYIWLDKSRTDQIYANLLSNAIKYTDPGGTVRLHVEQVPCDRPGYGKFVSIFSDNGCGMSREFIASIFEPFNRDDAAIRNGSQGTGLGMTIVKKLVDAMKGCIEIESEPGQGTTVTLKFEYRLATPEEIAEAEENSDNDSVIVSEASGGKRILVVEDNELNREIAIDLLNERGYLTEAAEDGLVALRMVKDAAARKEWDYYSAVLMDIQMPVMNGYDATRKIREIPFPEDVHLPIIAMTANAFDEDRQNAIIAGMDDHIAKPIKVKSFYETLEKYI